MLGRLAIGSVGMAITPISTIRMLQTVVSTGRLMKLSENAMADLSCWRPWRIPWRASPERHC